MGAPDFETGNYRFWFAEVEERSEFFVYVDVGRFDQKIITDEDVKEIQSFFRDLGKWESFIKAGRNILKDLGIKMETEEPYEEEFGAEKYKMDFIKMKDVVRVIMELTPEERLRRTKGTRSYGVKLSKEEVLNQIKNIPRWKTLAKTISAFKTL